MRLRIEVEVEVKRKRKEVEEGMRISPQREGRPPSGVAG